MTVLKVSELVCPVCTEEFKSQSVVSTNSFGGKRTDFHERAAGTQPLPYLVHVCPGCGYAGGERDFKDDVLDSHARSMLRERFDAMPKSQSGSEKYERAALVAVALDQEPRHVGDLWLRAAWCAVDEGDHEAERFYRRKAAWAIEEALTPFGGVAQEERAILTYLVGELYRRIGDRRRATHFFDEVEIEIVDRSTQQWVLDAARQQRDCPREWFG